MKPQRRKKWIIQSREVTGSLVQVVRVKVAFDSMSVPHFLWFQIFAKSAQNPREGLSTNWVIKSRSP